MTKDYEEKLEEFYQIEDMYSFEWGEFKKEGNKDEIYAYVEKLIDEGYIDFGDLSDYQSVIKDNYDEALEVFVEGQIEELYKLKKGEV